MKKSIWLPLVAVASTNAAVIVDHTHDLSAVPDSILTQVRNAAPIIHYAHRSDGSAVPWGLEKMSEQDASQWPYAEGWVSTPSASSGLRFWNGMVSGDYIYSDGYWATGAGTEELRTILQGNPSIRYTSWTWCNEDDYYSLADLGVYFVKMDSLERAFPNVTFIYQTAAMRDPGSDDAKVNQAIFNDSLRSWAVRNNKVLFDWADMDVWHADDKNMDTVSWNGGDTVIPYQHPFWAEGNGATNGGHHANDSMGFDKARAWWFLMAQLETDWRPDGATSVISIPRASYVGASKPILMVREGGLQVHGFSGWVDLRGRRLHLAPR